MGPSNALRERIRYWVGEGYRVVSETDTAAQLVRPKRFNSAEFLAMPLYLIEYLGQKDSTVYVTVEPTGEIRENGSAFDKSRYRRAQDRPAWQRLLYVVIVFIIVVGLILIIQSAS